MIVLVSLGLSCLQLLEFVKKLLRLCKKAATDGQWVHPKDLRKILKKLRIPISDETFEYACNDRRIIRYPKDPEMFSFATFFKPFLVFRTGRKRQAVAGQLEMFRHEALAKFRKHDINDSGTMNRKEVRMMMSDIHGEPVSVATVTHVLSIVDKGYTHEETITMDEVIHAVALWQCLQKVQDSIEAHFADYDTDNTDSLDASQVRHMLTDLNDGHLVSLGEVDWVIESADDGDGKLTRDEARSAIALWYMNVGLSDLTPNQGAKTLIPWIYAFVLGLMCCLLVAAVSVQFSEEKTMGWNCAG